MNGGKEILRIDLLIKVCKKELVKNIVKIKIEEFDKFECFEKIFLN